METVSYFAPGRAELLGNHTDTSGGSVLSAALDRGVTVHARRRDDGVMQMKSQKHDETWRGGHGAGGSSAPQRGHWSGYPLGVVMELAGRGIKVGGFEIEIESTLAMGSGLGSSGALCVATTLCMLELFGGEMEPIEVAKVARGAEFRFAKVRCGLLDPVSSLMAQGDHALLLDCANEQVDWTPFPAGYDLVFLRSGASHALSDSPYGQRQQEVASACATLGVSQLCEVSPQEVEAARDRLGEVGYRRALHVTTEINRVQRGAEALRTGESAIEAFGALMFESHESSRVNFENSTVELDCLVELGRTAPGCVGARLTGAGWGGATVNLVQREKMHVFSLYMNREVLRHFGFDPNYLVSPACAGARKV